MRPQANPFQGALPTQSILRDVGCAHCGALQHLGRQAGHSLLECRVCRSPLERSSVAGLSLVFALVCAALILLIPANLEPFLTTSALGVSRQSVLASSAVTMWTDGWPWLALAIGLFVLVFPVLRLGLLAAVLGAIQFEAKPRWLGPAFRWANGLQQWAMADVFLLGLWVAYARLSATINVQLGLGALCFIGVGLLSLLIRAALDQGEVWRRILPDTDAAIGAPACSCIACDLVVPASSAGQPCPRCARTITARETDSVGRTLALTLAGLLLYIPANVFPIATLPIGLNPTKYTVLQGVIDLGQSGLFGLALLVFCASFAIPFLKLAGIGYCLVSVFRKSRRRLVAKTRIYRAVEEIGRWSMVDPFVIACFVPVMHYNTFIYGRAEQAAPAFAGVVILTMVAARMFDPRLMWDAAFSAPPTARRFA